MHFTSNSTVRSSRNLDADDCDVVTIQGQTIRCSFVRTVIELGSTCCGRQPAYEYDITRMSAVAGHDATPVVGHENKHGHRTSKYKF